MKNFMLFIIILLISFSITQAQLQPGSSILIFNVGWLSATPEYSDNDLTGNTFMFCYEASDLDGKLAGGVSIGYISTSADSVSASGSTLERANSVKMEVVPIMLYGKYMFGSDKFKGYVGAGLGMQFSNTDFYTENVQGSAADSGFLIGGLLGAHYFINEKLMINATYSLNWMANSYFQDGTIHNIAVGLGFQLN